MKCLTEVYGESALEKAEKRCSKCHHKVGALTSGGHQNLHGNLVSVLYCERFIITPFQGWLQLARRESTFDPNAVRGDL